MRLPAAAAICLLSVGLTGCGPSALSASGPTTAGGGAGDGAGPVRPAAPPPAVLTDDVAPDGTLPASSRLTVAVTDGTLTDVALTDPAGTPVPTGPPSATSWTGPAELVPNTGFTLVAHALGLDGRTATLSRSFRAGPPRTTLTTDVTPSGDQVVGVAYPVTVRFNAPVTDRAAVERSLTVGADRDLGPAGWSWVSSRRIDFRPRQFWPAHARVTVHVALTGVKAGDGLWGVTGRDVTFSTGAAQVLTVSNADHRATFTRDGVVVRSLGVSLGYRF